MSELPATEAVDAATAAIDALEPVALSRMLAAAHAAAVDVNVAAAQALARATDAVVETLLGGGRVVAVGAGTSGRLTVLDAAELPPTFGWDPARWEARIAGGDRALRSAIEGAEDDADAGAAAVAGYGAGDCAIGVSASGGAAFVVGALRHARAAGCATVAIVNAPGSPLEEEAEIAIVLPTGAEPIAGSTRMRAGTAQKIALNTISTGAMIRLGKTYGNRMVDVVATNAKLRARAERLVRELTGTADAAAALAAANGSVKVAVVMTKRGVDRANAEALLDAAKGRLADVIGQM